VIHEITNAACSEYHQMCDAMLYSIDSKTFIEAYLKGAIDLDIIKSRLQIIQKKGKRLGEE